MSKSKKISTADKVMLDELAKAASAESISCSYKDAFRTENINELDKLFENYKGSYICKEIDTGQPVGNELDALDKISPRGLRWDDYEKDNFTPEEITASDLRVAKMTRKIHAKWKRKQFWNRLFRKVGKS